MTDWGLILSCLECRETIASGTKEKLSTKYQCSVSRLGVSKGIGQSHKNGTRLLLSTLFFCVNNKASRGIFRFL